MKKRKKTKLKRIMYFIGGIALIIFGILPTPDDITIIAPILSITTGAGLIAKAFK